MFHNSRKAMLLGSTPFAAPAILRSALMFTGPQANIMIGLLPHLWAGMDVVSRELVGMVPSVSRNATFERAALNQEVTYPVSTTMGTHDNTPAMSVPEPEDHELNVGRVRITKSKNVNFGFVGEEQLAISAGVGDLTLQAQFFAEGLRTLVNEVENDLFDVGVEMASRAWGTPGTTPFGDDKVTASAQLRRILNENGAPLTGRSLVLDSAAAANVISNWNLTRTNEAGTSMTLRQGELLPLSGFSVKETGASQYHTKGTGASATTNTAGYAVGARTITLASAGTGTILKGDVITFAGDVNKYIVTSGDTDVSNGGTIQIAAPGLRVAIPAAATLITVANSFSAAGLAFSADAIVLAARAPAIPKEGDMAVESYLMTDPRSGLTFDVRIYLGYKKVRYEVGLAWGWGVPNPEHLALLLG